MKTYIDRLTADTFFEQGLETLSYHSIDENTAEFPLIVPQYIHTLGKVASTGGPSKLLVEAMSVFGKKPKRIIDVGSGTCTEALYLAAHGHEVTALDTNAESLDWARERARDLGIPTERFTPKVGDLTEITTSDKYHGVISLMVLHFLESSDAVRAVGAFRAMTLPNGLNVISAYTEDNPTEEITHPSRGLKYMFKSGELSRLYGDWQLHRDEEGYSGKATHRNFGPGKDVLIPTLAEIIARKTVSRPTSYMNANREIVTVS